MIYNILFVFITSFLFQSNSTSTLSLEITKLDVEEEGQLIIRLYKGEENWLEDEKHILELKKKIISDSMLIRIDSMMVGKGYAVSLFHDEDDDNELDFGFFPPGPSEGVGVSNNNFRIGKPSYDDAKFEITSDGKTLKIQMNY